MSEFSKLEDVIKAAVDSLKIEENEASNRKRQYLDLQEAAESNPNAKASGCLVDIGCGIWVHKSADELKSYILRRLKSWDTELEKLRMKIIACEERLISLREVQEHHNMVHDAANPTEAIVDIEEQLDDEDNVISAKVNGDAIGQFDSTASVSHSDVHEGPAQSGDQLDDAELEELLKDMEVIGNGINERRQSETGYAGNFGNVCETPERQGESDLKDLKNVYELELIAEDFGQLMTENDTHEIEEFNYDFESGSEERFSDKEVRENENDDEDGTEDEDEEEEEEEEEDDEGEENAVSRISLIPGNRALSERLWQEIQAKRDMRLATDRSDDKPKKSVRFKESLEIKEIENVGAALKQIEHKKQSVSKFKEAKLLNNQQLRKATNPISQTVRQHNINRADLKPKEARGAYTNDVTSDIREKIFDIEQHDDPESERESEFKSLELEVESETKRKRESKFKRMLVQNPQNKPAGEKAVSLSDIVDNSAVEIRDSRENQQPSSSPLMEDLTDSDDTGGSNDLQKLIRAYNAGEFDEEAEVTGPLINELQDFEKINKMIESMSSDSKEDAFKPFTSADEVDAHSSFNELSSDEDEDNVIIDDIVENDLEDSDSYMTGEEVEQAVMNREIYDNYTKLKQKLFQRETETSDVIEKMEEENSDERVSRFKASRQAGI